MNADQAFLCDPRSSAFIGGPVSFLERTEGRLGGFGLVVVGGVDIGEAGVFLGEFFQHENRISRTNRDAGAAIGPAAGRSRCMRRPRWSRTSSRRGWPTALRSSSRFPAPR